MLAASRREALPNSKRSSANNRWLIAGEDLAIFIPFIFPSLSSWSKSLESTSDPRIKRKGERGSPCLKPLLGENNPKGLPFKRMEKDEEEIQSSIHCSQIAWNPKFFITARIRFHSSLSKAFSISILRNMNPPFPLLSLKE
jgi:hypothetical protein